MWHVVVPVKAWAAAKSRLSLTDADRVDLAQAMVSDTLTATRGCQVVSHVTVLAADRSLVGSPVLSSADTVVVQPDPAQTLNAALHWFATSLGDPCSPIAVVVADLPAARVASLAEVLGVAHAAAGDGHRMSMVGDRAGSGTTVLAATTADVLDPHFGPMSALAHQRRGAAVLSGFPDLACDVDTLDDLSSAEQVGLGPRTRDVVARLRL
jgi:2-phospho-L-lactate guanylyltransferase